MYSNDFCDNKDQNLSWYQVMKITTNMKHQDFKRNTTLNNSVKSIQNTQSQSLQQLWNSIASFI